MFWVLNMLDEPDTHMKEYNLTTEEKKELFLESQRKVAEIQMGIARLHSKERSVQVGNKTIEFIGSIPPWAIPPWGDEMDEAIHLDENAAQSGEQRDS